MCQEGNPKRSGNDDRKEVIYNEIYQEYETKPHQLIGEKIADADVSGRLKEVLIEMQIWDWRETET